MPDVVVYFGVNVASQLGPVTAQFVASKPSFLAQSAAAFAKTLSVPAANVFAMNITDVATGEVVKVAT